MQKIFVATIEKIKLGIFELYIQLSLTLISIFTVVEFSSPAACAAVTNAFSQSVLFRVYEGVNIVSGFLLKGSVVILLLAALVKQFP